MSIAIVGALFLIFAMLYSSVGHGGASGYIAAMALTGVPSDVMKPTALVLNVLVATIGTYQFARAGCFSLRLFLPFALASVPAAYLGGWVVLPGAFHKRLVGAVLAAAAARLLFKIKSDPSKQAAGVSWPVALCSGGFIGLLSGLTATGGGIFLSPLLLISGWADARITSGVSAAFVLVNSISGLLGHFAKGGGLPFELVYWAPAAVAGGVVGSTFGSKRFGNETLRRLLAVVLMVASLKLILNA